MYYALPRSNLAHICEEADRKGLGWDDMKVAGISNPRISSVSMGGRIFLDQAELGWRDEDTTMPADVLDQLIEEVEGLGVAFGSAGFVASQLAAKNVRIPDQFYPLPTDPERCKGKWPGAVRASEFGGRQELYWHQVALVPGAEVRVLDAQKAYMNILTQPLPLGSPLELSQNKLIKRVRRGATIESSVLIAGKWQVRASKVQPLPYRDAKSNVAFPAGRWFGVYWLEEVDAKGVELVEPYKAWSFQKQPFLRGVADKLLGLCETSVFPAFWKAVGVRLVGNLASEGPKKKVIHVEQVLREKADKKLSYEYYPLFGAWWLRVGKPHPRSYARIQSFSYATMLCRVALREMMERVSGGILAVHTDGIYCSSHDLQHGKSLDLDGVNTKSSQPWCKWRQKDRFTGEWMSFRGLGAGTWYLEDMGEVVAERRTGVPKSLPWSDVKPGKVKIDTYPGAGRIHMSGGFTGTPEVYEW